MAQAVKPSLVSTDELVVALHAAQTIASKGDNLWIDARVTNLTNSTLEVQLVVIVPTGMVPLGGKCSATTCNATRQLPPKGDGGLDFEVQVMETSAIALQFNYDYGTDVIKHTLPPLTIDVR